MMIAHAPAGYLPAQRDEACARFQRIYPRYETTQILDDLRAREYGRLDRLGHVYLDHTGGGLYAESQLRDHMDLLRENVFGNPHSTNPTSVASTHLGEQARERVLDFFNADPDEYAVIFTPNASSALRLVGEAYPFGPGDRYLLTFDNHNSVNGLREFARARGAATTYVPVVAPELHIDADFLMRELDRVTPGQHHLFAYPAQSNFSGVQHELGWIALAQQRGWDVLVDAAAFAPCNRLDLSRWHPDFVPLSFYKIFGYPAGVGCLLARKAALAKLHRPWFAGGTITIASVRGDGHYLAEGATGFEDGTVNYLSLPAVEIGLRYIAGIGIDRIHDRVSCLTAWLLDELQALRHTNGWPLIQLYGPPTGAGRGGTVTLNFIDPSGRLCDSRRVEAAANLLNISLRTGCFCNPGADEIAHGRTAADLAPFFNRSEPVFMDEFIAAMGDKTGGGVRISLGLVSSFADVYRFMAFAQTFVDRCAAEL
jgi:selenocysteine lyase/cysteine desulfurase